MPSLNIRNITDETHQALRMQAARHGRSMEAEVRAILEHALAPTQQLGLGATLAAIGLDLGGIELDNTRDRTPPEPAPFE